MSSQSGLGAFSIDNLLGRNKNKPAAKETSRNNRGCCGCPMDRNMSTHGFGMKCRCRCHDGQRHQQQQQQQHQHQHQHQLSLSSTLGQKERKRTTFTEAQNKGMRRIFDQKRYLDGGERDEIAKRFDLTPAQVKRKWQNFRAKETKNVQAPMFSTGLTNGYSRSLSYSAAAQPYVKPISSYNDRRLSSNTGSILHSNSYLSHNLKANSGSYLGKDLGFFSECKTTNNKNSLNSSAFNLGPWFG